MKQDIKLIAIDIDGTLIDDNFTVSENTIDTIKALKEKGVEVSLVTGRAHCGAKKVMNQIGVKLPIISHNGGKVTLEDGKVILNEKFPISYIDKVLDHGEKNDIYMKVYIDDLFYVTVESELNEWSAKNHGMDYKIIENFNKEILEDINLLIMFYDYEIGEEHLEEFGHLNVEVTTSMPRAIELIPKGVSKAMGLRQLKKHLNIKQEEILAIGNSFNDLSMLEFAGKGIAMKNSDPILLNSFDNISEFTNNEEGVYKILREYI